MRDIKGSEITPRETFLSRRTFLRGTVAAGTAVAVGAALSGGFGEARAPVKHGAKLPAKRNARLSTDETPTAFEQATTYTNFYEFETDKVDSARKAASLRTRPWTVKVGGAVKKERTLDIDDILRRFPLEERVYRFRCVETWAMVVPWVGFPLAAFLKSVDPTSNAKYVAFETLYDPRQMPNQRSSVLDWPYREGLRMDEAMHPLTLLAVGMYGEVLPRANGAPIRLVVPWKYGFKSIKSIVSIRLVEKQPPTTWSRAAPDEYGFYANVNPQVDHPRWSQKMELRLGEKEKRKTQMFNGYASEVAHLYRGMNLRRHL